MRTEIISAATLMAISSGVWLDLESDWGIGVLELRPLNALTLESGKDFLYLVRTAHHTEISEVFVVELGKNFGVHAVPLSHDRNPTVRALDDVLHDICVVDTLRFRSPGIGVQGGQVFAVIHNDDTKTQVRHDARQSKRNVSATDLIERVEPAECASEKPGMPVVFEGPRCARIGLKTDPGMRHLQDALSIGF